jgi:hypothetical protein
VYIKHNIVHRVKRIIVGASRLPFKTYLTIRSAGKRTAKGSFSPDEAGIPSEYSFSFDGVEETKHGGVTMTVRELVAKPLEAVQNLYQRAGCPTASDSDFGVLSHFQNAVAVMGGDEVRTVRKLNQFYRHTQGQWSCHADSQCLFCRYHALAR